MDNIGKVYIVILNWNGWEDTVECLNSVFQNHYNDYQVIVCDNGSHDNSLDYIKAWANGTLKLSFGLTSPYDFKEIVKPVSFVEYERSEAEAGGDLGKSNTQLILIDNGDNLGYAGGNNVGLRFALAHGDFEYAWLLNNDTVIDPNALVSLVNRVKKEKTAGLCGSTLVYYHKPDQVQAFGGFQYNKWLGSSSLIGHFSDKNTIPSSESVEKSMFGVLGASVLVRREFLISVGLLSEDYFLYFEEQDWAVRARAKYSLAYAPKSIVFHKEGRSIGANSYDECHKSLKGDYYNIKSRLLFTKKFFPYALPTVYFGLIVTIFNRIRRGQLKRVSMIIKIFIEHIAQLL